MSIELVMPSSHLILCRPLLLLPSIFPSIRVFSNESALCIRWPKYWSFSFSISPSSEHPGLISFRMDWLDLLADLFTASLVLSLPEHHIVRIIQYIAFSDWQLSVTNMHLTHVCFWPDSSFHFSEKVFTFGCPWPLLLCACFL